MRLKEELGTGKTSQTPFMLARPPGRVELPGMSYFLSFYAPNCALLVDRTNGGIEGSQTSRYDSSRTRKVSPWNSSGHLTSSLYFAHGFYCRQEYCLASRTGWVWEEHNPQHTRPLHLPAASTRRFPILGTK